MSLKSKVPLTFEEKKRRAKFSRIFRIYGITKEQYEELDKGYCPICLQHWSDNIRPAIDHDHISGRVRGLLCLYCNRYRVGRFRDISLVQRIADYLRDALILPEYLVPKKKRKIRRKRKIKK